MRRMHIRAHASNSILRSSTAGFEHYLILYATHVHGQLVPFQSSLHSLHPPRYTASASSANFSRFIYSISPLPSATSPQLPRLHSSHMTLSSSCHRVYPGPESDAIRTHSLLASSSRPILCPQRPGPFERCNRSITRTHEQVTWISSRHRRTPLVNAAGPPAGCSSS